MLHCAFLIHTSVGSSTVLKLPELGLYNLEKNKEHGDHKDGNRQLAFQFN